MGSRNRHKDWDANLIQVNVRGSTTVEKGDLLILDQSDNLRNVGSSTANRTAYPFSFVNGTTQTITSNKLLAYQNFLGVAMDESEEGVTGPITVATAGLFVFPLRWGKKVNVGDVVMPCGSGTTRLYNQTIELWQSGSTYPLGYAVRRGSKTINIEMSLHSNVIKRAYRIST